MRSFPGDSRDGCAKPATTRGTHSNRRADKVWRRIGTALGLVPDLELAAIEEQFPIEIAGKAYIIYTLLTCSLLYFDASAYKKPRKGLSLF